MTIEAKEESMLSPVIMMKGRNESLLLIAEEDGQVEILFFFAIALPGNELKHDRLFCGQNHGKWEFPELLIFLTEGFYESLVLSGDHGLAIAVERIQRDLIHHSGRIEVYPGQLPGASVVKSDQCVLELEARGIE